MNELQLDYPCQFILEFICIQRTYGNALCKWVHSFDVFANLNSIDWILLNLRNAVRRSMHVHVYRHTNSIEIKLLLFTLLVAYLLEVQIEVTNCNWNSREINKVNYIVQAQSSLRKNEKISLICFYEAYSVSVLWLSDRIEGPVTLSDYYVISFNVYFPLFVNVEWNKRCHWTCKN